jgi:hypothetical protein
MSLDPALIPAELPDGLATVYRELVALVEIEQHPAPFATLVSVALCSR